MKKGRRFREFRSGRVLEPSSFTPCSQTEEEAPREWTGQQWLGLGRRSPLAGSFAPAVSAGKLQALGGFLSPPLGVHRAWELLGPDVVGLPESRPAGEEYRPVYPEP